MSGLLKSIELRDNLYKTLKLCPVDSPEYIVYKRNLKMYQWYLNQCIRTVKKECYINQFTKYENDIRKARNTFKDIICEIKSEYLPFYGQKVRRYQEVKNIADALNEYFTQIGTSLANSIDIANTATFDTYIKKLNYSSFQFQYTCLAQICLSGFASHLHMKDNMYHHTIMHCWKSINWIRMLFGCNKRAKQCN